MQEIHELQALELAILLDVNEVCKKHNIKFFLGEGTLLGAIRHKGFIPWDDDVDLIMPREEYERFLKVAPEELGEKYEVQHSTTVENYWSPFIKVRSLADDSKFRQGHISHLTDKNGPYIDIFPMEYVPQKKSLKIYKVAFFIRFYRGMLSYKLGLRQPKHFRGELLKLVSRLYSVKAIHNGLDKNFKAFGKGEMPYIATFSSYHPLSCQIVESEAYDKQLDWDFEGYKLPVPNGYDKILTTIYGDYMTPPPEEKRVIKHHFYSGEH